MKKFKVTYIESVAYEVDAEGVDAEDIQNQFNKGEISFVDAVAKNGDLYIYSIQKVGHAEGHSPDDHAKRISGDRLCEAFVQDC